MRIASAALGAVLAAMLLASCSTAPIKDAGRPSGGENASASAAVKPGDHPRAVSDWDTRRERARKAQGQVPPSDTRPYPHSLNGATGSPYRQKHSKEPS